MKEIADIMILGIFLSVLLWIKQMSGFFFSSV